jgi:hypothetical protein
VWSGQLHVVTTSFIIGHVSSHAPDENLVSGREIFHHCLSKHKLGVIRPLPKGNTWYFYPVACHIIDKELEGER